MTEQEIMDFIEENEWIFAKSMPKNPHEYCLKEKCGDPAAFEKFVMHIRENGYEQRFFRMKFIYFDVGRYQYWTMGAPLDQTILINRAEKK